MNPRSFYVQSTKDVSAFPKMLPGKERQLILSNCLMNLLEATPYQKALPPMMQSPPRFWFHHWYRRLSYFYRHPPELGEYACNPA